MLIKKQDAGSYTINFDAKTLASGMYIYTIKAGDYTATKKMMLMK
ncbi:MAG: T9SS type A sorting domain-containing protein [Ignavibacteriales bacterium]|nr:T9SS type A sorting domain-containing protein [Ignavibacteriales bacterium]